MGYHVKVAELYTAFQSICTQIEQWQSQLNQAQTALLAAQETAAIKGNTGDNIRSYITEVQCPLVEALKQMLEEFQVKLTVYIQGYAELDDSPAAELLSERLEYQQELLQQELAQFQTLSGEFNDILKSVSDIVPVNYPHTSKVEDLFTELGTDSQKLNTKVGEYEETHKTDSQSVEEMINTIQNIISSRSGEGITASDYVPGSYVMNPAYGTLKKQVITSKIQQNLYNVRTTASFWTQTDGYFDGPWWQDEKKLARAIAYLELEATMSGGIELHKLLENYEDPLTQRKLDALRGISGAIKDYTASNLQTTLNSAHLSVGETWNTDTCILKAENLQKILEWHQDIPEWIKEGGHFLENGGSDLILGATGIGTAKLMYGNMGTGNGSNGIKGAGGAKPSANTKVNSLPEVKAGNQINVKDTTNHWDDYLGKNTTNINPRTGKTDPNRIFSADGTKSIRFGQHEMDSMGTSKFHYHAETWGYDSASDTMSVGNTLYRIKE